jgi:hypothetical protein
MAGAAEASRGAHLQPTTHTQTQLLTAAAERRNLIGLLEDERRVLLGKKDEAARDGVIFDEISALRLEEVGQRLARLSAEAARPGLSIADLTTPPRSPSVADAAATPGLVASSASAVRAPMRVTSVERAALLRSRGRASPLAIGGRTALEASLDAEAANPRAVGTLSAGAAAGDGFSGTLLPQRLLADAHAAAQLTSTTRAGGMAVSAAQTVGGGASASGALVAVAGGSRTLTVARAVATRMPDVHPATLDEVKAAPLRPDDVAPYAAGVARDAYDPLHPLVLQQAARACPVPLDEPRLRALWAAPPLDPHGAGVAALGDVVAFFAAQDHHGAGSGAAQFVVTQLAHVNPRVRELAGRRGVDVAEVVRTESLLRVRFEEFALLAAKWAQL